MFNVIGIMFAGAILGYFLRERKFLKVVPKGISVTIIILLFVMGTEIGGNKDVMSNIVSLGSQAMLISVAATLGSVVMALVVYLLFFKNKPAIKKGEESDE